MRAAVEAGGTKFVCAVGTGPEDLRASTTIPTTTPEETLDRVEAFLVEHHRPAGPLEALGIASFGPIDLRAGSPTYGSILATPKRGWEGTDLVGRLRRRFDVPMAFDTDVNGAAFGEHRWGASQGLGSSAYVTVGTGIGGGAITRGRPLHGLLHPEMGHLLVRRHPDDDHPGSCPFHHDCLEGLASGPAIQQRYGRPATELGDDLAQAVEIEASYLAQLVLAIVFVLSPERIILGGGVLQLPGLLDAVRARTLEDMAGSLDVPALTEGIEDYLVPPGLGGRSGVLGALALAEHAQAGGEDARALYDASRPPGAGGAR